MHLGIIWIILCYIFNDRLHKINYKYIIIDHLLDTVFTYGHTENNIILNL